MRARYLVVLALAAAVAMGCTAAELKTQKDDAWKMVPQGLPDTYDPNPSGYGHPLRGLAFAAHPFGVALDWILIRPFYRLTALAPEWWGFTAEDAQRFQEHHPELITPQNAPRRLE